METRPSLHRRTLSSESTSSTCSAQRIILEHIMSYPGTYEIPLRTMYALNASSLTGTPMNTAFPSKTHSRNNSGCALPSAAPTAPLPATPGVNEAAKQLNASLMAEVSQLPNQPNSLPASFVTSFARKCFTSDLSDVDFAQALTGLDYLRDLETRRRKEMQAALERLNIKPEAIENAEHDLSIEYPGILDWFRSVESKERKVDAIYSQIYVGLRRWILINEMSLTPFNKHNCLAMLNTVYPPMQTQAPTTLLTLSVLNNMREQFFKLIQSVQKYGTRALRNVIRQGKRAGEIDGWLALRESLDSYLVMANSMIIECSEVLDIKDPARLTAAPLGRRKIDSGIDMPLDSRKSSVSSEKDCAASMIEPVQQRRSMISDDVDSVPRSMSLQPPQSNKQQQQQPHHVKSHSTLERIARELKHMARSKTEISEIISDSPLVAQISSFDELPSSRPNALRKMRSLSALNIKRSNTHREPNSRPETPIFDLEKIREQRQLYEANLSSTHLQSPPVVAMAH